jgi:hypothetical protein
MTLSLKRTFVQTSLAILLGKRVKGVENDCHGL